MASPAPTTSARRADIDSLRVIALLLLIAYHVLLVFTGYWRVSSEHVGYWAEYIMTAFTPWRMPLVFLVGGIAARFMFDHMNAGRFVQDRAAKLLTAFVFAVVVITPLQRFVRLEEIGAPPEDYMHYLFEHAPFVIHYYDVWLPDVAHAWFLPYLFLYSVVIALAWKAQPALFERAAKALEEAPLWLLAAGLMGWLCFVETAVLPRWPRTGLLFPDVGAHLKFIPPFVVGVLLARSSVFTQKLLARKFVLFGLAAALMGISLALKYQFFHGGGSEFPWQAARGLYSGVALLALLAFAAWALNRPSPALTYATDAILPVYLLHQTVLVVVADIIVLRHWPLAAELAVLSTAALLIPLAIYHVAVRPTPWLRMLFGLRPHARGIPPRPQAVKARHPKPATM